MNIFELKLLNPRFDAAESAIRLAAEQLSEKFKSRKEFRYFEEAFAKANLEISLELLEELTVGNENEFPREFWKQLARAANFLKMSDEARYYEMMMKNAGLNS